MNKKIAFFTEMGFKGKISRDYPNMKTMEAWICALDADHIPIIDCSNIEEYDLGIIVIPKNWFKLKIDHSFNILDNIKKFIKPKCKKIAIMQEGPHNYFQDYSIKHQFIYYHILFDADFLLCHNDFDINYYKGLTGMNTYPLQSLMITDLIEQNNNNYDKKDAIIIGGNFVAWYSGFSTYRIATYVNKKIYCVSMGRMQESELKISNIEYLKYMDWYQWMIRLREMSYAIHLMRTYAAGTFFLNTSYFGIPTIGYENLDTQRILHPSLTIKEGDLKTAREYIERLVSDKEFYNKCSVESIQNYKKYYSEEIFKQKFEEILKKENV